MREIAAISNLKNLPVLISQWAVRLRVPVRSLWSVLTFSAADERIAPKKDICIALDHSGFSIAYGTRFMSRISIKSARSFQPEEQGYPQPVDVASSSALAFREFSAMGAGITLSIPKAWATVKTVEIPSAVRKNLPDVIAYELDRLTPFSHDEAYYDFRVLDESPDKITITVVAVKASLLSRYLEALRDKGIEVSRVTTSLSGIGALYGLAHKGKDVLFTEMHDDNYEGALYIDGSLAGALGDSFAATDEKSKADEITAGIAPLVALAGKLRRSPRFVAHTEGKDMALQELLRTKIDLNNQQNLSALGGVVESLSPKTRKMDLLKKGRQGEAKAPIAVTVIFILAILGLGLAYVIAPLEAEEEKLRDIERQIKLKGKAIKDVEMIRKEMDAVNNEITSINDFKNKEPMYVAILKELTDILPRSAWLSRVRITGSTVEIEGYANSATELLPRLEASQLFRKTEFTAPTYRDARKNADRFGIKMEIKGSEENKGTQPKEEKKGILPKYEKK